MATLMASTLALVLKSLRLIMPTKTLEEQSTTSMILTSVTWLKQLMVFFTMKVPAVPIILSIAAFDNVVPIHDVASCLLQMSPSKQPEKKKSFAPTFTKLAPVVGPHSVAKRIAPNLQIPVVVQDPVDETVDPDKEDKEAKHRQIMKSAAMSHGVAQFLNDAERWNLISVNRHFHQVLHKESAQEINRQNLRICLEALHGSYLAHLSAMRSNKMNVNENVKYDSEKDADLFMNIAQIGEEVLPLLLNDPGIKEALDELRQTVMNSQGNLCKDANYIRENTNILSREGLLGKVYKLLWNEIWSRHHVVRSGHDYRLGQGLHLFWSYVKHVSNGNNSRDRLESQPVEYQIPDRYEYQIPDRDQFKRAVIRRDFARPQFATRPAMPKVDPLDCLKRALLNTETEYHAASMAIKYQINPGQTQPFYHHIERWVELAHELMKAEAKRNQGHFRMARKFYEVNSRTQNLEHSLLKYLQRDLMCFAFKLVEEFEENGLEVRKPVAQSSV